MLLGLACGGEALRRGECVSMNGEKKTYDIILYLYNQSKCVKIMGYLRFLSFSFIKQAQ